MDRMDCWRTAPQRAGQRTIDKPLSSNHPANPAIPKIPVQTVFYRMNRWPRWISGRLPQRASPRTIDKPLSSNHPANPIIPKIPVQTVFYGQDGFQDSDLLKAPLREQSTSLSPQTILLILPSQKSQFRQFFMAKMDFRTSPTKSQPENNRQASLSSNHPTNPAIPKIPVQTVLIARMPSKRHSENKRQSSLLKPSH
jgi:hypothetical protein